MPISMSDIGSQVTIKKISGSDEVRQHLATLGFVVGEDVVVINKNGGNMILNVKDSRIALDKSLANRIYI